MDKSLAQFDGSGPGTGTAPARYRLLETVRQYAAGQLQAQGPAAASTGRTAHRDYYLVLAETVSPHLVARDQAQWLERLDMELDNLRAAIAFSLTQADPAPGLRLATSLQVFWRCAGTPPKEPMRCGRSSAAGYQGTTLLRAEALAAAAPSSRQ